MIKVNRLMTNICSDRLIETRDFYINLFDLTVHYESDWFIQLISKDKKFELGIIDRTNDIVPEDFQKLPQGFYITFVVNDADEVYEITKKMNYEVVSKPTDTFYGQRRLLVKDPNGALVDVSSIIKT